MIMYLGTMNKSWQYVTPVEKGAMSACQSHRISHGTWMFGLYKRDKGSVSRGAETNGRKWAWRSVFGQTRTRQRALTCLVGVAHPWLGAQTPNSQPAKHGQNETKRLTSRSTL